MYYSVILDIAKEKDDMEKSDIKDGVSLRTFDGEIIDVRVYNDGWIKMSGYNLFKEFENVEEAFPFILKHRMTLV